MTTTIWWIRRDLRLTDNAPLHAGLQAGPLIPVYLLDPRLDSTSPRRRNFLYAGLHALDRDLRARGSYLVLRRGYPLDVLRALLAESGATSIVAERDYTPFARRRDAEIARHLPLTLLEGQTVHSPDSLLKLDGTPYTVYTPYSKAWKARLSEIRLLPAPQGISTPAGIATEPLPAFRPEPSFPAGEGPAQQRLERFLHGPIWEYADQRNRLDLDSTSRLSPYLRFGMISLRQAAHAVLQAQQALPAEAPPSARRGLETWLNELIWREFYIQILYHFPYVSHTAFRRDLAHIPWRNEEAEFAAWKEGRTGVPIVDAAMRQLLETGWMHNRARMIVASFLVKDLLIDWRWGEAWFLEHLLDGDPAANNGGWQWTAGVGTDAAPYFRIFNPILQSKKFDPHGEYIRRWLPELRHLDSQTIHAPWQFGVRISGYPPHPIVDHEAVRQRTLQAYQNATPL